MQPETNEAIKKESLLPATQPILSQYRKGVKSISINDYLSIFKNAGCSDERIKREADYTAVWNDDACKGYTILAAHEIGMSDQQIETLLEDLDVYQNITSVEEAAKVYTEFF